jgi:hypothetical protein
VIAKSEFSANLLAALLLVARPHLQALDLAQVSAKNVLEATGATKTRAYELSKAIPGCLDELVGPVGRPPACDGEPATTRADALRVLTSRVMEYLLAHPGAAQRTATKGHYSPEFCDFVVEECVGHPELDAEEIACALTIPVTTLRGWLRAARAGVQQVRDLADENERTAAPSLGNSSTSGLHVQTVLTQWPSWCGNNFSAFCEHLQKHHGVPFGRTTITSILELAGERIPRKRPGRSPDEHAMRGAFASFFPGAVWVGDGCELVIEIGDRPHRFNLELLVDTHSDAFVGLDIRDHEDANAVIGAFNEGVAMTSAPPLALLLDNKPSNHAPAVHEATEGTLVIPATKSRPQNKGHVEGAFGLFSQNAPPLCIDGKTLKERARSILELCVRIFFSALNMRPRAQREGQSRIKLYNANGATPEQIEQAKTALQARLDKQHAAQETLRKRQDPAKRAYLDDALPRLKLTDPTGHVQAAIARYNLGDIANGIAIFSGKKKARTLPDGVDIRYLRGIIKNITFEREGMAVATEQWDERIKARDFLFASLIAERDAIDNTDPDARLVDIVDRALTSEPQFELYFWLDAAAELVLEHPPTRRRAVFERVARRIHAAYRVPYEQRLHATRVIVGKVLPLA